MKILMLSIFAPHFFNWTEQLKDSGHEVYWLDIFDSNTKVEKIDFAEQIIGWRYKWDYLGRYFLKKNVPKLTQGINLINERNFEIFFERKLKQIQPDVVHSFVMFISCYPILKIMKKYPHIKWIYSAWGSDMFFLANSEKHQKEAKLVLPEIDYLYTDCKRDYEIALKYGFRGCFLGVFPGGGGYDLEFDVNCLKPLEERNLILIKGYEGEFGRCIKVLEAIQILKEELKNYNVIIFGSPKKVVKYVEKSALKNWENLKVKPKISHSTVMQLMGQAVIYIGNSTSDGMPNTLLESIVMGAFPIQSNPGGATAELITHKKNGLLIEEPDNPEEISNLLLKALRNSELRNKAVAWNLENIKPNLERERIKARVLKAYQKIEKEL